VLHIRNLPPEVTEQEVMDLCRPFGRIVRTKVNAGQTKNQAFVEFDTVSSAIQMISFFVGNTDPPKVGC
jgi:polypyrimidine tract-binding protein 2